MNQQENALRMHVHQFFMIDECIDRNENRYSLNIHRNRNIDICCQILNNINFMLKLKLIMNEIRFNFDH